MIKSEKTMATKKTSPMQAVLEKQRASFMDAMQESLSIRGDRLTRAIAMLVDHADAFSKAMSDDFGHRSHEQSLLTDIMPSITALKNARKHFQNWARGEKRKALFPLGFIGAKAKLVFQPKGVIGLVAPWNYPVGMVMVPMADILAAGNRAMVKPSEFTERTSALFAELIPQYFDETEIAVITGGPEVGQEFSSLAFDHMIFTGATSIGKHIMRAAAENLVPVTLELGGKSPTIIGRSADKQKAADRIVIGKMMNAGQTCLAPDYLLVHADQEQEMIAGMKSSVAAMYPTLLHNDDYTSVVNGRNYDRLQSYLTDAVAKGAEAIEVNPAGEDFAGSNGHKMPLTLLRNVTSDMKVMQEEIFGPILPVMTYNVIDEAIDYVNANDRPLGLYYFGKDQTEESRVLNRTTSGGVTVNDVIFHVAMDDLPFGGIGPSGMGHYHGFDGFKTFSHQRAIFRQTNVDVAKIGGIKPPYGKASAKTIAGALKK
jgi:coniferyl-aldehyde dehydrogenase